MFVERAGVKTAARRVDAAGQDVPARAVEVAADAGADAVDGGALPAALREVGADLAADLARYGQECQQWAAAVAVALAEYEASDRDARARLDRLGPVIV